MAAPLINIEVDQGASFTTTLTMKTSDGGTPPVLTPVDLSGCTARMMIRSSYTATTPLVSLTTENGGIVLGGLSGTIEINLTAVQTLALPVTIPTNYNLKHGPPTQLYVSDLDVTFSDGEVKRYANFAITVSATVTK